MAAAIGKGQNVNQRRGRALAGWATGGDGTRRNHTWTTTAGALPSRPARLAAARQVHLLFNLDAIVDILRPHAECNVTDIPDGQNETAGWLAVSL